MKKENQRVVLTKRLLREALFCLLEKEKLEKITITKLCKEADINRATFYHHYTAPQDVLIEAATELAEDLRQLTPPAQSQADIEKFMEEVCIYLKEHADVVKILIQFDTDKNLANALDEINRQIWENGHLLIHPSLLDLDNTLLISTFFISGAYHMIRRWLVEDIQKTPKEIASLICSAVRFDFFQMQ